MDASKAGPNNLEKGYPGAHHLEPCCARSAQPPRPHRLRSLVKHPWIVFGIVALTWLLFSYGKRAFSQPYHVWRWDGDQVGCASSAKSVAHQCVDSTNWTTYHDQPPWAPDLPHGAETTFSLPLDSEGLFLVSRGLDQYGVVNIEQSSEVVDTVTVRVRVAYQDKQALEQATVCRIEKADSKYGVGIFTPQIGHRLPHRLPEGRLAFDVTLTLPAAKDGPLSVQSLDTTLPDYSQSITNLRESVFFDHISLASVRGLLNAKSIRFGSGRFSSVNGEIEGDFSARSSLELRTVHGRIAATANLLHRENQDIPKLQIHAVSGQIDANVSLTSEVLTGGEFEVETKLRGSGNIGLRFTDTPVDSVLRCRAETVTGKIQVELDSAFEGTYSLQSVLGKKLVVQHSVEDPAGKGRQRVVSLNEGFRRVQGDLRWVESDGSSSENKGHVELEAVTATLALVV